MKYDFDITPEPISGVEKVNIFGINSSSELHCSFVRVKELSSDSYIINLKLESEFNSIFQQLEIINETIIIGYGSNFSVFDLKNKKTKKTLFFEGYFGSFIVDQDDIFIATDNSIINITFDRNVKWTSQILGTDGVNINEIIDNHIIGSGEWDPPGGWKPFELNRETGKKL